MPKSITRYVFSDRLNSVLLLFGYWMIVTTMSADKLCSIKGYEDNAPCGLPEYCLTPCLLFTEAYYLREKERQMYIKTRLSGNLISASNITFYVSFYTFYYVI